MSIQPHDDSPPSARSVLVGTLACEGGLLLLSLALGGLLSMPPWMAIGFSARAIGEGVAATVPLVVGLIVLMRYPVGPLRRLEQIARELIVPLFCRCSVAHLAVIAALAGIGEEFFFRGFLQQGLAEWSGADWLAVIVAAAVFGAAHPITATYALLAAAVGVYLGWLLIASQNLLVPMITHALYDFVALLYLIRTTATAEMPPRAIALAEPTEN